MLDRGVIVYEIRDMGVAQHSCRWLNMNCNNSLFVSQLPHWRKDQRPCS